MFGNLEDSLDSLKGFGQNLLILRNKNDVRYTLLNYWFVYITFRIIVLLQLLGYDYSTIE